MTETLAAIAPDALAAHDDPALAIVDALRRGDLPTDDLFDAIYAPRWRELSWQHWTPIDIADMAVTWLTGGGARRVLDVGAGVGKLCVYGALATPEEVSFVGVEHRAELVEVAREAAARLGVGDRVEIRHAALDEVDTSEFDALYLYNPFAENLSTDDVELIDASVALGAESFRRDVAIVEGWLRRAPRGTRLVTFHGFGGVVPEEYRLVASQRVGWDALRAWEKRGEARR